jgi:hypothetical protein
VGARMTLYRLHVHDPTFFRADLKVTMQASAGGARDVIFPCKMTYHPWLIGTRRYPNP